ncbi:MAG TPA: hypothetical protein VMF09_06275 [Solirubrobacteraceae bacterium]|nr:hypothetical protein [Solirubrobacteraceae bacterium]
MSGAEIGLAVSVFLACTVEAVEALTIVLAVGTTRGWGGAVGGVGAATLLLAVLVAVLGAALTNLPIDVLRAGVGGLLLIFGLQWLRKAILRAAHLKAKHDERQAYRRELDAARAAGDGSSGFDGYAFAVSFKGVLLEGLEVVFIVLSFGANQHRVSLAAAAAGLAVVLVIAAGVAARAPLARVPENTMKFAVGVMLSSFGVFWGAEGVGVSWPGGEAALLVIICGLLLAAVAMSRGAFARGRLAEQSQTTHPSRSGPRMRATWAGQRLLGAWEFIVGDDWRTAVGVVLALTLTGVLAETTGSAWWIMPLAVIGLLGRSVSDEARSSPRA